MCTGQPTIIKELMMKKVIGYPNKSVNNKMQAKTPHRRIMEVLALKWTSLSDEVLHGQDTGKSYDGYTCDDMMLEAFERVVRNDSLIDADEETILSVFKTEFRFSRTKIVKNKQLKYKLLQGTDE